MQRIRTPFHPAEPLPGPTDGKHIACATLIHTKEGRPFLTGTSAGCPELPGFAGTDTVRKVSALHPVGITVKFFGLPEGTVGGGERRHFLFRRQEGTPLPRFLCGKRHNHIRVPEFRDLAGGRVCGVFPMIDPLVSAEIFINLQKVCYLQPIGKTVFRRHGITGAGRPGLVRERKCLRPIQTERKTRRFFYKFHVITIPFG